MVFCPIYYQIVRRQDERWFFHQGGKIIYNPSGFEVKFKNLEEQYGLTKQKIVLELYLINGGNSGYYLANLKERKYYYCGNQSSGIKKTLFNLGIGRPEPDCSGGK